MSTFDIWVQGYRDGGGSSTASKVNSEPIEAESFDQAVSIHFETVHPNERGWWRRNEDGHWSIWACRLFPDELSARKTFG